MEPRRNLKLGLLAFGKESSTLHPTLIIWRPPIPSSALNCDDPQDSRLEMIIKIIKKMIMKMIVIVIMKMIGCSNNNDKSFDMPPFDKCLILLLVFCAGISVSSCVSDYYYSSKFRQKSKSTKVSATVHMRT